ncbi:hypothetical protein [Pimelobacter simplex]|uniref:hypothetical protein n=1 Tax=Nocardioides simplex TaxID=2045 RepID=UPI003AABB2A0
MTRVVDLPDPLPDGGRFLHIGLPKTGTTALQGALADARDRLESLGAHNVSRDRHEMRVGQVAAGGLPAFWGSDWDDRWAELAAEYRSSPARCTFWSSESLSHATGQRVSYLAETLGADSRIVVTLRPLAPLLVSQWQQWLRRRGTRSLEDWARDQFAAVTAAGEVTVTGRRFMPTLQRFDLGRIVREWGAAFGESNVILVAPSADRARNFRVFEALMGVPEVLRPADEANESLPYPEAEALRRFNLAYTEGGGDHPTWMRAMNVLARKPLRELARDAELHPIRAPRWIAEQANEHASRWLDEIASSNATVVGDLSALLVDPLDFAEEVPVPTEVSTGSAGRLMDIAFAAGLAEGRRTAARPDDDRTPDVPTLGARVRRHLPGRGRR